MSRASRLASLYYENECKATKNKWIVEVYEKEMRTKSQAYKDAIKELLVLEAKDCFISGEAHRDESLAAEMLQEIFSKREGNCKNCSLERKCRIWMENIYD